MGPVVALTFLKNPVVTLNILKGATTLTISPVISPQFNQRTDQCQNWLPLYRRCKNVYKSQKEREKPITLEKKMDQICMDCKYMQFLTFNEL